MQHHGAGRGGLRAVLADEQRSPADPQVSKVLDDLQGNILKSHGRDHSAHIFLRFADSERGRAWLRRFAGSVTSYREQHRQSCAYKKGEGDPGQLFLGIMLSAQGYRALGYGVDSMDQRFVLGMRHPDVRAWLWDPPSHSWDAGLQQDIHALVIAATDDDTGGPGGRLDHYIESLRSDLDGAASIVHVERGWVKRHEKRSVEHFGFADGISQPVFPGQPGYSGRRVWNDGAPLGLVLAADPHGNDPLSCGSYIVYRKLRQDVDGFCAAVKQIADRLHTSCDWVEAQAVGRYRDGTPAVLAPRPRGWETKPGNDFSYEGDPDGLRCPFHSHMRKVNPRGDKGMALARFEIGRRWFGGLRYALFRLPVVRRLIGSWQCLFGPAADARTTQDRIERTRRIARRGILYGHPERGEKAGILFLCAQADIARQFEFIQNVWSNKNTFVRDGTGIDPVIGAAPQQPSGQVWRRRWSRARPYIQQDLSSYVHLEGGEYFFAPSISFLAGARPPGHRHAAEHQAEYQ